MMSHCASTARTRKMDENMVHAVNCRLIPELLKMYVYFSERCRFPDVSESFRLRLLSKREGASLRRYRSECLYPPDRKRYASIEMKRKSFQRCVDESRKDRKAGMYVQACDENHFRMSIVFSAKDRLFYGKAMDALKEKFKATSWAPRGHYYYPASGSYGGCGFCSWHTNELDPPGWRMYLVKIQDEEEEDEESSPTSLEESHFTYIHPDSGKLQMLRDRNYVAVLFKVDVGANVLWHNVYAGRHHRWSLGFVIDDAMASGILNRKSNDRRHS